MGTSFSPASLFSNIKSLATPDTKVENPAAAPKAPVVRDVGSYKNLSDLQAHGYGKDQKTAQFMAARQLKDPSKAPTPSLRLQAVSGKVQRVFDSEKYKGLSPENKALVGSHYYDKYIVPSFKENGIEPPAKADWIQNHAASVGSEDVRPKSSTLGIGASALVSGESDVARLTANVLKYSIGSGTIPGFEKGTRDSVLSKRIDSTVDRVTKFADDLQKVSTNYDSTFATRHDASAWAANFGGHIIGDAPAYMAAGAVAEGIVPSLAEKAAISKGFKVGYSALKASGEVFSVSEGEGKGFKESAINAGAALLLGGALTGAIARFSGAKLAVGGEPFARTIAEDASIGAHPEYDAMSKEHWAEAERRAEADGHKRPVEGYLPHTQSERESIEDMTGRPYDPIKDEARLRRTKGVKALVNKNDPDYKQVVNNERWLREQLARQFHPDKAESAGDKSTWRNLSKGQRTKIISHIDVITKQQAELMPLVNPELQTIANVKELHTEALSNPQFASRMDAIEKMTGLKVSEILTKVQGEAVGRSSGLTSPAKVLQDSFGEPIEQGDIFGERMGGTKGAKTVSNKSLLNPLLPESGFVDGTRKYLEPNSGSKNVGGYENFENPKDHLLWIANHSNAPEAIKNRAFGLLRSNYNLSRSEAGLSRAGGWLAEHRADLATTGKLDSEGNIYRSTNTTQRRYGTKWQRELYTDDLVKSDLKSLGQLFKRKPELKATIEPMIEALNALRNKAATPLTSKLRRSTQESVQNILRDYK